MPYIFIAPRGPLGDRRDRRRVYRKHYRRPWKASAPELWLLGKILDAGADAMRGELLSYVFSAGEFAEELIQLGQADAQAGSMSTPPTSGNSSRYPTGPPTPHTRPQRARARAAAGELATVAREESNGGG